MTSKLLSVILLVLLAADLGYSFYNYYFSTIDGDFPAIVLATEPYNKVLEDPFGMDVLGGDRYAAPNRFTAHAVMSTYFKTVPFALQYVTNPIESIYLCIALTKILVHIGLLFLISYYVSAWNGFRWKNILIAAVIISPLFHSSLVYVDQLSVIDPCITYVMFYPLPICAILLYFLPFYRYLITGMISRSPIFIAVWMVFALFLVLFGPLPAPILITGISILFAHIVIKNFGRNPDPEHFRRLLTAATTINRTVLISLSGTLILSFYSMYIGSKNTENDWSPLALEERYSKLFTGVKEILSNQNYGLQFWYAATAFNLILLYLLYRKRHRKYFKLVFFLFVFCLLYIAMLPLGGYRDYRPLILRRDTLIPVTCIVMYCWASSGMLLAAALPKFKKAGIFVFIAGISFYYTQKDFVPFSALNTPCEKTVLSTIAASETDCIALPRDCTIASWNFNNECAQSENVATLLYYYNITPRKIYIHYPENVE
ncbi:MAG: hypothetical protein EOP53_15680 [Sphingobacteriales bacterium]|nr:MAG: hypothetical protein EOP53_15680 [Sphingobacteriales bacterium]